MKQTPWTVDKNTNKVASMGSMSNFICLVWLIDIIILCYTIRTSVNNTAAAAIFGI